MQPKRFTNSCRMLPRPRPKMHCLLTLPIITVQEVQLSPEMKLSLQTLRAPNLLDMRIHWRQRRVINASFWVGFGSLRQVKLTRRKQLEVAAELRGAPTEGEGKGVPAAKARPKSKATAKAKAKAGAKAQQSSQRVPEPAASPKAGAKAKAKANATRKRKAVPAEEAPATPSPKPKRRGRKPEPSKVSAELCQEVASKVPGSGRPRGSARGWEKGESHLCEEGASQD